MILVSQKLSYNSGLVHLLQLPGASTLVPLAKNADQHVANPRQEDARIHLVVVQKKPHLVEMIAVSVTMIVETATTMIEGIVTMTAVIELVHQRIVTAIAK